MKEILTKLCIKHATEIIKDYKKLKQNVANDFIQTIKEFKKRHPYIRYIEYRSNHMPWLSNGRIYMNDKFDIDVCEDDVHIKE